MSAPSNPERLREHRRKNIVLVVLMVVFATVAIGQLSQSRARREPRPLAPRVDRLLLDTAPSRASYRDMVKAREDVAHYSCYLCHERGQVPILKFDDRHRLIVPEEHSDIIMLHGSHDRNNHCYNCHNEQDLESFHIRDGRNLGPAESSTLCGSCHGPTYSDWEAGAHGRISGYWDRSRGESHRLDCVNCHDPHAPRIKPRPPAPGPRPLRPRPPAPTHP